MGMERAQKEQRTPADNPPRLARSGAKTFVRVLLLASLVAVAFALPSSLCRPPWAVLGRLNSLLLLHSRRNLGAIPRLNEGRGLLVPSVHVCAQAFGGGELRAV